MKNTMTDDSPNPSIDLSSLVSFVLKEEILDFLDHYVIASYALYCQEQVKTIFDTKDAEAACQIFKPLSSLSNLLPPKNKIGNPLNSNLYIALTEKLNTIIDQTPHEYAKQFFDTLLAAANQQFLLLPEVEEEEKDPSGLEKRFNEWQEELSAFQKSPQVTNKITTPKQTVARNPLFTLWACRRSGRVSPAPHVSSSSLPKYDPPSYR